MDSVCVRCARLALAGGRAARGNSRISSRSFTSAHVQQARDDSGDSGDSGVASAGRSMADAVKRNSGAESQPRKPLVIRRQSVDASARAEGQAPRPRPIIRRTAVPNQGTQTSSPPGGQLLRRVGGSQGGSSQPPQQGSVLRRTGGPPQGGSLLRRTGPPGTAGPNRDGRTGGGTQRAGQRGPPQKGGMDKRRRRARSEDADDVDQDAVNNDMDAYIAKYIDRPETALEALPYTPKPLSLEDIKADWPNTPLSNSGMTESVIQKVQWLARRLPHGYQTPEDIAERYLQGDLVRFESEEEKQIVLKIASEQSANSKRMTEEDFTSRGKDPNKFTESGFVPASFYKGEKPLRFLPHKETDFISITSKEGDKSHLVDDGIKGDYSVGDKKVQEQKYPFLQNVARMLNNNETFGPVQTQKLLDRVNALIPQRGRAAEQAKRAAA